ncbi:hypothetical protein PI125_g3498 [Phytophthora idaei]|nr:hypothetical protein PI125_g3498 [Phytophthora idaei]
MSLQDWSPHEAGAALQKWKKKLCQAFGAIGINEGKQPVSRMTTLEEDPSKIPLPQTPKRLERTSPTKHGADRGTFGAAEASTYFQDLHRMTPRSASRPRRMDTEDEGSQGPSSIKPIKSTQTVAGHELPEMVRDDVGLLPTLRSVMMTTYCLSHTKTKTLKPS